MIVELEAAPEVLKNLAGDVYFIESGSRQLRLDMCSIIPKEQFVTVVLIGKMIDSAESREDILEIVRRFMDMPQVKKILPPEVRLSCVCRPNMSIGAARRPYGQQVADIGDVVTSRLYKDGILSAFLTASALARAVTEVGTDKTRKFKQIAAEMGIGFSNSPEFERMYAIKIRSGCGSVFEEIGKFGDDAQQFFRPRMIRVRRLRGESLQTGNHLQYDVIIKQLNFIAVLEYYKPDGIIVYRLVSGFPSGGVLIFDIEPAAEHISILSIYVAFNFPRGKGLFSRMSRRLFRFFFPAYLHDVLWNHSLCKLKDIVENGNNVPMPAD